MSDVSSLKYARRKLCLSVVGVEDFAGFGESVLTGSESTSFGCVLPIAGTTRYLPPFAGYTQPVPDEDQLLLSWRGVNVEHDVLTRLLNWTCIVHENVEAQEDCPSAALEKKVEYLSRGIF